jgi:hypothetical protein
MSTNIITPYYIFHYVVNNIHIGYISNSVKIKQHDGTIILTCEQQPPYPWTYYSKFYAISPMFRPIPHGLKLISANKDNNKNITSQILYEYDPFNVKPNSVNFLTWTQPVPYTVPLYFHMFNKTGTVFPSFEKIPKGDKLNWSVVELSPIYVLVDNKDFKYKNGIPDFKFIGNYGRCIPSINGTHLGKCFLLNDENLKYTDIKKFSEPPSLLQNIKLKDIIQNQKKSKSFSKFFRKISTFYISIIIIFFLFSLFLYIFFT